MSGLTITWERVATQRDPDGGDLINAASGEILIDAVISSEHSFGGEQTKRPIESGAPATDHWRRSLSKVSLQCAHTDTPPNSSPDITVEAVDLSSGSKAVMGSLTAGGAVSRTQGLRDELQSLIYSGALVTVTGLNTTLTDWRILSLGTSQESGRSGLFMFSLELEEVIYSTLETVDSPAPRVERARPRTDDGGNSGSEADAPETNAERQRQSFLAGFRDDMSSVREATWESFGL